MADSIEAMGLFHNIVVRRTAVPGVYDLISGERRWRAQKLLVDEGKEQFAHIYSKIEDVEDDDFTELKLLHANSMARELSDYEKTYQVMRTKELLQSLKAKGHKFKGRLRDILADMYDVSPSQISKMESIDKKLIPGFEGEFKAENIGISDAYDLSMLPKNKQEETLTKFKEEGALAIKKATGKAAPKPAQASALAPSPKAAGTVVPLPQAKESQPQESKPVPHVAQANTTIEVKSEAEADTKANDAQREVLLKLGKEAVLEFIEADDPEMQVRFSYQIQAYQNVAVALDIPDYEDTIHAIPEYQRRYGVDKEEGAE